MVKYECKLCNVYTNNKYDFSKHIKTKKHISMNEMHDKLNKECEFKFLKEKVKLLEKSNKQ